MVLRLLWPTGKKLANQSYKEHSNMTKDRPVKTSRTKPSLSENEVRDYLLLHSDFFDLNKDLLTILKPRRTKRGDGVVDFQAILLDRLQSEVASLNDSQGLLINASRNNMTTQSRIHAAVLCLFEAEDIPHLCHMVNNDWVQMLQIDTITICFEDSTKTSLANSNIRPLASGTVNQFLGHENAVVLRGNVTAAEEIFGPATPLIKAEALIRIEEGDHHPLGILAFGSRDDEFFTVGQGTELLQFLAATFQAQLRKLLADTGC